MLNQITTRNLYSHSEIYDLYMMYIFMYIYIQMLYIKQTEFPESHRVL